MPAPVETPEITRPRLAEPLPGGRSPFLEALSILLTWRRVVLGFALGVVLVTVVYSLLARPIYVAHASLLPKQEEGQFGNLSSLVASQFGGFMNLSGMTSSTDILMAILESRYIQDRVIERLDLVRQFAIKAPTPERAREYARMRLDRIVSIDVSKRLSINLEVRAGSPQLAADIANAYFDELDRMNQEFSFTSARQTRMFIEQRLNETRDSLSVSQVRLETFQKQHGMVALDEQAKAEVEVASRLQAELIGLESQLDVQKQYSTSAFSKTRELEHRITALRARLGELAGRPDQELSPGRDTGRLMLTFRQMPTLGRQLANLMLDVKTQEAVYTLLTTQYQQMKIEEARDVPTIQVLDKASPPVFRDSPRRKKNVLIGLVLGLGGGALLAFGFEYLERSLRGSSGTRVRKQAAPVFSRVEGWLAGLKS